MIHIPKIHKHLLPRESFFFEILLIENAASPLNNSCECKIDKYSRCILEEKWLKLEMKWKGLSFNMVYV